MDTKNEVDSKPSVSYVNLGGEPGDAPASFGGGTLEILQVIKILEDASIPCCVLGISALKYYCAGRLRLKSTRPLPRLISSGSFLDWEIGISTEKVDAAAAFLKSEPHDQIYKTAPAVTPQPQSMIHTYPRFKLRGVDCSFILVPSDDYHFECLPSTIERSHWGLPYPKLEAFAQSLLDSRDLVSLTDLVDGMDLTEEWGQQNLDLTGTQDITWAKRKNEEIRQLVPDPDESCWYELNEKPFDRKETWVEIVTTKERRLGAERPKEVYATRFRGRDTQDPRITFRDRF